MARYILSLALVCLLSNAAHAAPLPEAPTSQPVFHAVDWTLAAYVVATHAGDYLSTEQGVREPARFREEQLPQALVHSHLGLAAYEAGTATLEVLAYWEMIRHGHRRMPARVVQAVNVGYTARVVAGNYEIDWSYPAPLQRA